MSKICMNCGNQMDDATMFCVNCGTPVPTPAPAPAAPVKQKKAAKVDVGGLTKDIKSNPKKLAILGGIAVALIVVIIIAVSLIKPYVGWQSALTNYFDLGEGKAAAVTKNIPKEAYDWIEDKYDLEKKDITSDKKDYAEDISKDAKDRYGDNFKVTFKGEKTKKFKKQMLENLADGIENSYDIDAKKVKAAYKADIKVDISGKEGFAWYEDTVTVVKIGGSWYVVDSYGGEGKEAYASLAGLGEIMSTETFQKEASKKK